MSQIKLSQRFIISSIAIITVIFFGVISPLKGLSIFTMPLILLGIVLWLTSVILLITGLSNKNKESYQKRTLLTVIILTIGFIPIGLFYMKISGYVRTKITINIINQSDFVPKNLLIYGTGDIFENTDTIKVNSFAHGEELTYIIWPTTKPNRNGYIRMEFDIKSKHIAKNIAGKFSVNPYNIQQEWKVTLDKEFFK